MRVKAKWRIRQSPLSDAPDVPRGTVGEIDDMDDCAGPPPLLVVDFGPPYGHVLTDVREVKRA